MIPQRWSDTVASNVVQGISVPAIQDVSWLASDTKAKDEMTLEYRVVVSTDGRTLATTATEKAKSGGEDLLTPIVERASQTIATVVSK